MPQAQPTGPLRKQNVACDPCRRAKVRCQRQSTNEQCAQCIAKNAECTSNYVDALLAKSKKKPNRSTTVEASHGDRTRLAEDGAGLSGIERDIGLPTARADASGSASGPQSQSVSTSAPSHPHTHLDVNFDRYEQNPPGAAWRDNGDRSNAALPTSIPSIERGEDPNGNVEPGSGLIRSHVTQDYNKLLTVPVPGSNIKQSLRAGRLPHELTPAQSQRNLLRYLFSPYPITNLEYGYSDLSDIQLCKDGQSDVWESLGGRLYDEKPSVAHLKIPLNGVEDLISDLLDTFFSIVHIRFPIYDPVTFRERFSQPDTHPLGPLTHANLAVAIAFGARFSDNPIISSDRDEIAAMMANGNFAEERFGNHTKQANWDSGSDQNGRPNLQRSPSHSLQSRSRIVQLLVVRAREVCEVRKTHRVVTLENCQALIMLEPLLGQSAFLGDKYQAHHAQAAVQHATTLGLMSPDTLISMADPTSKQSAVFMWWLTGLADGWRAVFNRLKPFLNDDDFDVEPPSFMLPVNTDLAGSVGGRGDERGDVPAESDNPTILWFAASNAGCYICRRLCAGLFTPRVRRSGIATSTLRDFIHANSQWRDKYIAKLGVPSQWPEQWDFLAAISSCSTDAYFHCLWMIVHRAIGEFGLEDEQAAAAVGGPTNRVELESLKRRIKDEADHGAMRIVALVSVFTENGYLRLDPLILYYPIFLAGLMLAEAGKSEYLACVAGLKQYSISFGHLWELAEEVEHVYTSRWRHPFPSNSSLSHLLLAPAGHLGPMGPWGLDGPVRTASSGSKDGSAMASGSGSGLVSRSYTDGGMGREEWHVTGAGAVLAANGFTALPMIPGSVEGMPAAPTKDTSAALYQWLRQ